MRAWRGKEKPGRLYAGTTHPYRDTSSDPIVSDQPSHLPPWISRWPAPRLPQRATAILLLAALGAGCSPPSGSIGSFEMVWGSRGISEGRFQKPRAMAIDAQDQIYVVDMTEFSVDKLANRGSLQAIPILTNVQDFMVNLRHNLA